MEIISVRIIDPKAKRLLQDLEELNLIEIDRIGKVPSSAKVQRRFGSMKGFVTHMADDFDAPLEDLRDYM